MNKLESKKPDRVITFEIGLIVALIAVKAFLGLGYKSDLAISDPIDEPYLDTLIIYTTPPQVQAPEPPEPEIKKSTFFSPSAIIKPVLNLFKNDEKMEIKPVLPKGPMKPLMIQPIPSPDTSNKIIRFASQMPQFPKGEDALRKYIRDNFDIPNQILEQEINTKVVVEFVVHKDGSITDIQVVNCENPGLGAEENAVSLIKSMPSWEPGNNNGRPVSVRLRLPINIKVY